MTRQAWLLAAIFILGMGLRTVDLWRPLDGRIRASWRESDMASVARNFDEEGMNPLYPRIDWRGTGPGYVEMELPILPWVMAATYRVVGRHEVIGRILSWLLAAVTMAGVVFVARRVLPPAGTMAALGFFAISPLPVRLATGIQPDGLMLAGYVWGVVAFLRWLEDDRWSSFILAAGLTALAIVSKASAVHIGGVYLGLILWRRGWAGMRSWRPWLMAILTLIPAILWYRHAHQFWLIYGNSLGISNEAHWVGTALFTNPSLLLDIVRIDVLYVWMPAGALLAIVSAAWGWRSEAVQLALLWLGSIAIFYLAAGGTTGEAWASYYHVVASVPVALLFGVGVARSIDAVRTPNRRSMALAVVVMGLAALTASQALRFVIRDFHPRFLVEHYRCARTFKPHLPSGALILVSGGHCTDLEGHLAAYNASYMFYWTERRGFNICHEAQSVPAIRVFGSRGARWFIAEQAALDLVPGFEAELDQTYRVAASCSVAKLYAIEGSP